MLAYDVVFQDTDLTIYRFVVGQVETNCYVLDAAGHALVVDPGACGKELDQAIRTLDTQVEKIVITHGHGDHAGGVLQLKHACGAQFVMSEKDAYAAQHCAHGGALGLTYDDDAPAPDAYLCQGDELSIGDVVLKVYETPGHTPGGLVLLGQGFAFVGDTLFAGSCGRCDLAGGSEEEMMKTLARLKHIIPEKTTILPGHNRITTFAEELVSNPFLLQV